MKSSPSHRTGMPAADLPQPMTILRYLSEMRAMGYTFFVIEKHNKPGHADGVLTMYPPYPASMGGDYAMELDRWQRDHSTKAELMQAILDTPPDPGEPANMTGRFKTPYPIQNGKAA